MLDPKTFVCKRCGKCCIEYTAILSKADIKRIKRLGYDEVDFAEIDKNLPEPENFVLKEKSNYECVFLTKNKKGVYSCKIYDSRPTVCRRYPFLKKNVETCKPVTFLNTR